MAHMMRVAFHQSGFAFQYRSLMRQRACCCCCFSADCCLLSALPSPQNSLPPPPFFPETAQRPPAGRSAEQLYLGPLLSLSLSRLFVPPRRVSRMLAKTEHLRDERAIHYRAAPPPPPPLLGPQRFPVSAPIAPHAWKFTPSREAGKWMLTSAFVRGADYFHTRFWA